MPRRDGTGPMGAGPKTGRNLGNCTTEETVSNGYNFVGSGRGLGNFATGNRGYGMSGRGRSCRKGNGNGFGRCFNRGVDYQQDANQR